MYRPIKLTATNFQSFKELDFNFQISKAILIEGDNQTDDGQETNGSGKSTILEMVFYCLLGMSSNGKRDAKLIRWGEKEAMVQLTLTNDYLKKELVIERHLFTGTKSVTLSISMNGKSLSNRYSSVAEGNKLILDLLDISAEDLKNYYLINRKRFVSFFDSPDTAKRSLLARFSNVDRIQKVSDEIDTMISDRQQEISKLQSEKLKYESKIDLLNQQIEEEKQKDEYEEKKKDLEDKIKSCEARKKSLKKELDDLEASLFSIQQSKDKFEENLVSLNDQVKEMESIDFASKLQENQKKQDALQEKINTCKQKKTDLEGTITELQSDIQPIMIALQGIIKCPKCGAEFTTEKDVDIEEYRKLVEETNQIVSGLKDDIANQAKKITDLQNSLEMSTLKQERLKIIQERDDNTRKIAEFKRLKISPVSDQVLSAQKSLSFTKNEKVRKIAEQESNEKLLTDLNKQLSSLSKDNVPNNVMKLEKQRDSYEEQKDKVREQMENLESYNQVDRQWKERINQFYIYVTNKTLTLIQSHCNYYLEKIDSGLRLRFEGFKQLSDGKIKESINAVIMRDGEEESDYKCFSGGEQARLILSTILTFQEFINQKSKSGGFGLSMIDEILDQTDSMGLSNLLHCLNVNPVSQSSIFLISQVNIEGSREERMRVTKKDGISYIAD